MADHQKDWGEKMDLVERIQAHPYSINDFELMCSTEFSYLLKKSTVAHPSTLKDKNLGDFADFYDCNKIITTHKLDQPHWKETHTSGRYRFYMRQP